MIVHDYHYQRSEIQGSIDNRFLQLNQYYAASILDTLA